MKICTKCKIEKPLSEFSKAKGYKDGIRSICNECKRQTRRKRISPQNKTSNYQKDKNIKLKRAYCITYEDYLILLEKQGNCCAICGTDNVENNMAFSVDHNHDNGKVRGLLCNHCNTGIGGVTG